MNPTNSNSNSSSISNKTYDLPIGYVFSPDEDEIYSHFIPTRIIEGRTMDGVEEIDLYNKSPDALFGERDPTKHIYLFTRQRKEKPTHKRNIRTTGGGGGGGTWQGQKPSPCRRLLMGGEEIIIGTTRQFTYKGGLDDWIMHEYSIDDYYLNYIINGRTYLGPPNPENIVLCHIYKKKAKKVERKMNSIKNEEINHENVVDDRFNNNNEVLNVQNPQEEINTAVWIPNYSNDDPRLLLPYYGHGDQGSIVPEPIYNPEMQNYDHGDQGSIVPEPTYNPEMQNYGHGDQGFIVPEPTYIPEMQNYSHSDQVSIVPEPTYYQPTSELFNEGGDEFFTIQDLFN